MKIIESDNHLWELFDSGSAVFRFDQHEQEFVQLHSENDVALFNNIGHELFFMPINKAA